MDTKNRFIMCSLSSNFVFSLTLHFYVNIQIMSSINAVYFVAQCMHLIVFKIKSTYLGQILKSSEYRREMINV